MPIIYGDTSSPTIKKLGPSFIVNEKRATTADMRPLRVGLVNNMVDAALLSTEEGFLRLIGSEPVLQVNPVLITCNDVPRNKKAKTHIDTYYTPFEQAQEEGLDAMIISGTNFGNGPIDGLPFWDELVDIFGWAENNVVSTLTSCLATHAVMKYRHDIDRVLQGEKVWGVFDHKVIDKTHPLVSNMNSTIPVVHSRWNSISPEQFRATNNNILISSATAGVHLAVSQDFRWVMMQGHPEYHTVALAREYFRDKKESKFHEPSGYTTEQLRGLDIEKTYSNDEIELYGNLENNWKDSAQVILARWIAMVYKLTHFDIRKQYMDGIDPNNPIASLHR